MARWLSLILLGLLASCQSQAGIPRWDALPAMDVMHLQGPYAGRSVCPMCTHGYDAGVLVFLPSSTPPAQARRIALQLRAASEALRDPRFRPFLVFTGARPSPQLQAAVAGKVTNWYVGELSARDAPEVEAKFGLSLARQGHGFVFAQRRMLYAFNPTGTDLAWMQELPSYSRYALSFLQANYAKAVATTNPDTPKGRLWTAANQLTSALSFGGGAGARNGKLCFGAAESPRQAALVGISIAGEARVRWARSDGDGCVRMDGLAAKATLHAQVFSVLRPMASVSVRASKLEAQRALYVAMPGEAIATRVTGREPVTGAPCEGCEWVFEGMPAVLASSSRIAPATEAGEALTLTGVVHDAAGTPRAGIVVYAYQTDAAGEYPRAGTRHGRLRAWARTDAQGRYQFLSIRPAAYPGRGAPQHIHMHIIEPARCTYFIGDVLFTDDPLLDAEQIRRDSTARGGSGVVRPQGSAARGWKAQRDIQLGLRVPGYAECGSPAGPTARLSISPDDMAEWTQLVRKGV